MYLLNKICISLFLLFVVSVVSVSAQVVTTINGYPVIDLTELSPLSCVLSSSEASARRSTMNAQTPSNSALLGVGSSVSDHKGSWNAKMSSKFQVMRADYPIGTTNWANAYTLCQQYSDEDGLAGEWRLPTQRELQMIWILQPQLINKEGFTPFAASYYRSSTEGDTSIAWVVDFTNGAVRNYNKTSGYRARCVRDL